MARSQCDTLVVLEFSCNKVWQVYIILALSALPIPLVLLSIDINNMDSVKKNPSRRKKVEFA
jgi:hypothetical protein